MSGSKKNKRGDRGSTEEDPNICKRVNMAATEDTMDQEPTTEDPTITAVKITATETIYFEKIKTYRVSWRRLQLPFGNRGMKSPTLKPH